MKNNKPGYVIVDFEAYDDIDSALQMRKNKIMNTADEIIDSNMQAFLELAK